MARPTTIRTLIFTAIAAGAAYYLYAHFMAQPGGPGGPQGAPPVGVAEVMERKIRQWYEFSGRLAAVNRAEIRPRVSGVIEKVHFADGALVKKDDVLFTIDPRPFAAEAARAEGVLSSANAQWTLAKAELARSEKLFKDKAIPQRDYDQRRNDYNVAEANVKSARAALEVARLNLDYAHVKAPIDGRAGRAEITEGNLVESGNNGPVLTSVIAYDLIYADFEIDEATFLKYAQAGATGISQVGAIPVMITLGDSGNALTGHIESFDNRLNASSGTIRVRAVFPNKDGMLVPGLFARVRLGSAAEINTILISDRAVGTDQNKKFVYVVGNDNKVAYREIVLGPLADGGLRIVESGLKPGEKIVVSGTQRIMMPGQEVKPEASPMTDVRDQMPDKKAAP